MLKVAIRNISSIVLYDFGGGLRLVYGIKIQMGSLIRGISRCDAALFVDKLRIDVST